MEGCREFLRVLGDYLDGALEGETRVRIERHLDACSGCHVIWQTTRKTLELYKSMPLYGLPEEVESRLMEVLESGLRLKR